MFLVVARTNHMGAWRGRRINILSNTRSSNWWQTTNKLSLFTFISHLYSVLQSNMKWNIWDEQGELIDCVIKWHKTGCYDYVTIAASFMPLTFAQSSEDHKEINNEPLTESKIQKTKCDWILLDFSTNLFGFPSFFYFLFLCYFIFWQFCLTVGARFRAISSCCNSSSFPIGQLDPVFFFPSDDISLLNCDTFVLFLTQCDYISRWMTMLLEKKKKTKCSCFKRKRFQTKCNFKRKR